MKELKWVWQHYRLHLLFCLPLVCCLGLGSYFFSRFQKLNFLEAKVLQTHQKAMVLKKKKRQEERILTQLRNGAPSFSEKDLQFFVFLEPEIKKLEMLAEEEESVKKRLRFLKNGDNQLLFLEEKTRKIEGIEELELKQKHPIEANEEDLKKLLKTLEATPSSTQFLIKDFELTKKNIPLEEETVYLIHLGLIKRECS